MNVTIIIAVLNGEKTIERALKSIAAQTSRVFEIIIVNDGSTDATKSIIKNWSKRLPITLLENPENIGVAPSRARAVKASSGDVIFNLDADDSWKSNHIKTILQMVEETPQAVLFSTCANYRNETGALISVSSESSDATIRSKLMWDNPLVHSAVAYRREAYFRTEGYSPHYTWDDYHLWIQLLEHGQLAASPKTTADYFEYPDSLSRIKKRHSLQTRFALQMLAIKAFAGQHPLQAAKNLALVSVRKIAVRL